MPILLLQLLLFEMEKTKTMFKPAQTDSKIYACFQEHDTLKFMNFIEQNHNKLTFKGTNEEQGRKSKEFIFDQISFLNGKFKNVYGDAVKEVVEGLLRGESRTALIYGGDQSKKQKILIGESQNAGLLLTFLHELFQSCYDKEFEDKVTIKLSCWEHHQGEITDVIGTTQEKNLGMKGNFVANDQIEGKVVVGIPEIIIRNLKSALKMIKIFMKKVQQCREQKEEQTQTLVFTIKLEIDNAYDKQNNTTEYVLSKFHIVKLANPYYSKNASKHPQWFISLFNYLQGQVLDKSHKNEEQCGQESQFNMYLRDIVKYSHGVLNFTCFSNKTTSNECLTALKFNSYLQHVKNQGRSIKIDLMGLKQQQISLQGELAKAQGNEKNWMKGEQSAWLKQEQFEANRELQALMKSNIKIMELSNMLEYQYANVFTVACDKLEKYIFNQEIEDYFYAKKIDVDLSPQLKNALQKFFNCKREMFDNQNKLIKRINNIIVKLKRQNSEDRQYRYMLNLKTKEKQLLQKLFELYNTLSTHYLYEQNDIFASFLINYQNTLQKEVPKPTIQPIIPYQPTFLATYQQQKENSKPQPQPAIVKEPLKKKRNLDEMEMMFTNSNASLCGRRFKNGA